MALPGAEIRLLDCQARVCAIAALPSSVVRFKTIVMNISKEDRNDNKRLVTLKRPGLSQVRCYVRTEGSTSTVSYTRDSNCEPDAAKETKLLHWIKSEFRD